VTSTHCRYCGHLLASRQPHAGACKLFQEKTMKFPKNIAFCALAFCAGAWFASTYDGAKFSTYQIAIHKNEKYLRDISVTVMGEYLDLYSRCEMYVPEGDPWRKS
jgi:hypothetical protein